MAAFPVQSTDRAQRSRIVVSDLSKHYRNVRAVDHLSFTAEPGRVTGFLGPNGAGKTTTLRALLNLITPTAGVATIGGYRYADVPDPTGLVGAVLDASGSHLGRSGRNHLRFIAAAAGRPVSRVDEVLAMVGLQSAAKRRFRGYSLGMRQRLGIAAAMLGDPQVLILDEPVNGLDPEGIHWMRTLLRHLASQGRTILVSSHLLSEMQQLADDVVIIAQGRLITQGPLESIITAAAGAPRVRARTPQPELLITALRQATATVSANGDGALTIQGLDAAGVGGVALRAGVELHELVTERPELEQVFLNLTEGKAALR